MKRDVVACLQDSFIFGTVELSCIADDPRRQPATRAAGLVEGIYSATIHTLVQNDGTPHALLEAQA